MKKLGIIMILLFVSFLSACDDIGSLEEIILEIGIIPIQVEVFEEDIDFSEFMIVTGDTESDDVLNSFTFDSADLDLTTIGDYVVSYSYIDLDDVEQSGTLLVKVVDTLAPNIVLIGEDTVSIFVGDTYTELGVGITDNYWLDLTMDNVDIESNLDTETIGEYTISYSITDNSGNVSAVISRTVEVLEQPYPVISLVGEAVITIDVFDTYTDQGVIITDDHDIDLQAIVTESVDTSVLGEYIVSYDVVDSEGYNGITVTRTVIVVDTVAPEATIIGESNIDLFIGDVYFDEYIEATDNYDIDLLIEVGSDYNPFVIGNYEMIYTVTDSSGNKVEVTRYLNLSEAPVIESIYGLTILDNMEFIRQTIELDNGDFLIIGSGMSNGNINRIDVFGNIIWNVEITQEEYADVILENGILNDDNEIVVVGYKNYPSSGSAWFIAKYDLEGNELYYLEGDGADNISYQGVLQLSDGNYLLVASENYSVLSVIKVNPSFEQIWKYEYSGALWFQYMNENIDGSIDVYADRMWSNAIYKIDLDSLGNEINIKQTSIGFGIRDVFVEEDKYIVISEEAIGVIFEDDYVSYTISIEDEDVVTYGIDKLANGNYIVVGSIIIGDLQNDNEAIIIEVNDNFEVINYVIYEGTDYDTMYGTMITSSGKILTYGYTGSQDGSYFENENPWETGFIVLSPLDISTAGEVDSTGPAIDMNGENAINIALDSTYVEAGAVAIDEDIEVTVTIIGNVDTSKVGIYEVYYIAEDNVGNKNFVRRTVNVYETLTDSTTYIADIYSFMNEDNDLYDALYRYDYNNDGYLTLDETDQVTDINIYSKAIFNLEYFNQFRNLTSLYLNRSQINDITGISNLEQLITLSLGENSIIDISEIGSLTNLEKLHLYSNIITDISYITGLDNLTRLALSDNPITNLDALGVLPNLEILRADRLPATSFNNVSNYPKLISLNIGGGELSSVTGFNNPNLEYINFYGAKLVTLDGFEGLENSPNLTEVHLGQNVLTDVCGIATAVSITNLRIETNNIEDISCLDSLVNVETIVLVNNSISDLSVLAYMTKLEDISLGGGYSDITVLSSLENLKYLYVDLNSVNINVFTQNRRTIEILIDSGVEIQGGNIISFSNIDSALQDILEEYDTDNSNGIDVYECRNIKVIDLSGDNTYDISVFEQLEHLREVTLSESLIDTTEGSDDMILINDFESMGVTVIIQD